MLLVSAGGKSRLRFRLLLALGGLVISPAFAADKKPARDPAQDHVREELGVNQFTTPSIATMLTALRELRPIPYESVARDLSSQNPPNRAQLALTTGSSIADGFLAVAAEKQSRIEPIGRVLLRQAKGLGVGDYITR